MGRGPVTAFRKMPGRGPNSEQAATGPRRRPVKHTGPHQGGCPMQVGWDWASETHDVTVIDDRGHVVDRWSLAHDEAGIDQAIARLAGHGQPEQLPVAIELSSGLVVDRLLGAGHPVVPIHPSAFDATRPRWGAARAKSDPGDSYKLADLLRTDGHRLRRLKPLDATTRDLQALVRLRDDHVEAKTAATNQLGALLDAHWPGAKAIFARLDSPIALDFLERSPPPQAAERLGEARLTAFLRRHSYCGRRPAAELLGRLRAAPIAVAALDPDVLAGCIRAQVRLLRTLLGTLADLDRALVAALPEHPKTAVLQPLPRIGQVNLAQILAEVGPILDRATDLQHAAAEVGASPVTKQSGKTSSVHFRWAANPRARDAVAVFADNSRHAARWAATLDANARRRGKRHPQATRDLMRAWLRVIWACWHANTPYQGNRHRAQRRLAEESAASGLTQETHARSRAWVKSSARSGPSSRPTETRTMPAPMPAAASASASSWRWVVEAGGGGRGPRPPGGGAGPGEGGAPAER